MSVGSLDPTLRTLDDDDCCEGTRRRTPAEIYNRPGLQAVRYRRGTHARFKETMLARLSARDRKGVLEPPAEGGVEGERITDKENNGALEAFTARNDDDFTIALLDAFAAMADVLTFYQERVANEAYLRTATERFSVLELARLIGYQLDPGLAASTRLAFTLDDGPDAPPTVTIPARTPAQSVPKEADRLPQTFETVEEIEARAQWNELRPRMVRPQAVKLENKGVYLRRTNLNLRVGDMLLFVQRDKPSNPSDLRWDVRRITEVTPEPEMDRTLVRWVGEKVTDGRLFPQDVEVYVFRQRANVFGYNAADWRSLPDAAKATYLGITDPTELVESEKEEWPNFNLPAPAYPLEQLPAVQPTRKVIPTIQSVANAATSVADSVIEAVNTEALISLPDAAIKTIRALALTTEGLADIGRRFKTQYDQVTVDESDAIAELTKHLGYLIFVPGNEANNYNNVIKYLKQLMVNVPPMVVLTALMEIMDDIGDAFADVAEAIVEAVDATENVPESFAAAAGANITARVVTAAVQAAMDTPLPDLIRTPRLIAFVAIASAKIAVSAISGLIFGEGDIKNIAGILEKLTQKSENGDDGFLDALLGEDELLEKIVGEDEGLLFAMAGTASIVSTAVVATSLTTVFLLFGPAIIPIIAPLLLVAVLLDADMEQGAKEVETAVREAVWAALNIQTEQLSLRRPLVKLSDDKIDLDAIYPKLTPDSWLLLSLPNREALYKVADVAEASRNDFNLNARTTRVTLEGVRFDSLKILEEHIQQLSLPSHRNSTDLSLIRAVLEDGGLLDEELDQGSFIDKLDSALQQVDESLAKDIKSSILNLESTGYSPFLDEVRMTTVFAHSEALTVADEPWADPIAGDRIDLDRQVPRLEPGRLLIVAGIGVPADQPDGRAGTPVSELVTLSHHDGDGLDTLVFTNELKHVYERNSVRVFANVARATHGETQEEVLGSGDAGLASQSFQLKQTPLTYVAGQAEGGRASTLEVRVNDVLWEEAPFLHGSDPRRRAYSTEMDNEGRVTVRFGDGRHGARPHSGVENIRARYRNGVGQLGNVNAGEITLLTRRPPGLRAVTNPLPATGGTDPETYDDARRNAPGTVRLLERIVSLQDYEDYALTYPEVRKALATWVWEGRGRTIILTVAGQDGAQIEDARRETLRVDMRGRSDPHIGVRVEPFARVDFELAAKVLRDPNYEEEKVQAAVREALLAHFAFEKRQFGQPVTLVETMAVVQAVAGVVAVDVDCLYARAVESTPSSGSEPMVLCLSDSNLEDLQVYDNQLNCPEGSTPPPYLPAAMPQPASDRSSVQRAELLLPRQITLLFEKAAP